MERSVTFDDLLDIRKGEEGMTTGRGISRIEKINSVAEWELKAEALRELFRQTLGQQPPGIECPLSPRVVAEQDGDDYVQRKVECFLQPDERVSAYVLIPRNLKTRAPGVLCIHPTRAIGKESTIGNDDTAERENCSYALHLARRGYVTLSYDLLGMGERRYSHVRVFDTTPFYERYPDWSVRGKDLWDAARAIDLLQTMAEVDTERIGSIGYSQGGGITLHAMGLDPRIKVGVSSCGGWPMRLSKNPFNHARTGPNWIGRPFLRPYCLTGKNFPIDMHETLALIAPRPVLNLSALNDRCAKYTAAEEAVTRPAFQSLAENVSRVFALYGAESNFRNLLHMKGHSFLEEHRNVAYAFLDEFLKPAAQNAGGKEGDP